jgi:hypothetical protein
MTMTTVSIPLPPVLDDHPELAVLAALDAALKASVFSLVSAHPPMRDADQRQRDLPDSYWIASVFVSLAHQPGGCDPDLVIHAARRTFLRCVAA